MTVPGYPVAGTHTKYYGGEVHDLPLLEENGFFPDLDGIPADIKQRAKLLVINYPNSPTGAVATRDFYQRVIDFAHKQPDRRRAGRGPHPAELRRPAAELPAGGRGEGGRRRGPLDVEGLQHDRLAAWRSCAGHPKIVQAFADVKDNSDSGQFMAIQQAAAAALRAPRDRRARCATKYRRRLKKLVAALKQGRLPVRRCRAARTSSTPRPRRRAGDRTFANAEEASQFLIHEQIGLLRAVGRRRRLPALLGDLPRQGRAGGRPADGRDRRAAEGDEPAVLTGDRSQRAGRRSLLGACGAAVQREELRVEPGQQLPDLRDLFEGGRLADRGQFLRPHELRQVEARHVRLDHHVRRLHAEGVQVVVLDQQAAEDRRHDARLAPGRRRLLRL